MDCTTGAFSAQYSRSTIGSVEGADHPRMILPSKVVFLGQQTSFRGHNGTTFTGSHQIVQGITIGSYFSIKSRKKTFFPNYSNLIY
jgi:hypothetical protein